MDRSERARGVSGAVSGEASKRLRCVPHAFRRPGSGAGSVTPEGTKTPHAWSGVGSGVAPEPLPPFLLVAPRARGARSTMQESVGGGGVSSLSSRIVRRVASGGLLSTAVVVRY